MVGGSSPRAAETARALRERAAEDVDVLLVLAGTGADEGLAQGCDVARSERPSTSAPARDWAIHVRPDAVVGAVADLGDPDRSAERLLRVALLPRASRTPR